MKHVNDIGTFYARNKVVSFKLIAEKAALRVEPSIFTKTQTADFIIKHNQIKWSLTLEHKVTYWLNKMCIIVCHKVQMALAPNTSFHLNGWSNIFNKRIDTSRL